ncbi:polysaccharide lyase [Pedobacter sp. HDW13]|uniref:pectate lyase family protein n=1 Tax=unclassified Pedobacter TaxID=2628915 RepID=UPI000F5A4EA0|nr:MULTISPECIES: polysaccharide lyase [unclassified Pedobacter]QIL41904.1 polysaccharide lyase [Pedobacter sp. HDW13]RQO68455.1 polysaccharide lyase [Pedobacter sp. KBW01]
MKKNLLNLLLATALTLPVNYAFAQYPNIPADIKKSSDSMMKEAYHQSDIAWEKAKPIMEKEAKMGKPYIPWAGRPNDLPQSELLAFPGAEGGGAYSFGGHGGRVIVVKNLNDKGPGSLRDACEQGGARIVVFNVAGIIRLKTPLIIRAPYITIAGQTAPGDGVCVAGESVWLNTHDVIVRFMRFRRGETFVGRRDDAIGGNPVGNIMIDHVSASWGLDENMSMYRHMYNDSTGKTEEKLGTVNITIQNSIFSEALDYWNHAFGSTLGGENCAFVRNLWADNGARNPSIGWNGIFNFANNVVFNWNNRSTDGGDYTAQYNIINNFYKPGPVTELGDPISYRILKPESGRSKLPYVVFGRAYVNGNIIEGNEKVTRDNWNGGVQMEDKKGGLMSFETASKYFPAMKAQKPFPMPKISIIPTLQAKDYVLANAGATLPKRDPVDTRVIKQVATGKIEVHPDAKPSAFQFEHRRLAKDSYKHGIITEISQVGGYPEYKGTPYKDTDDDGMPDTYEIKNGLNPKDATDAVKITKSGYSNIEVYLNSVVPVSIVKPNTK